MCGEGEKECEDELHGSLDGHHRCPRQVELLAEIKERLVGITYGDDS